jgi:hypothetical protein
LIFSSTNSNNHPANAQDRGYFLDNVGIERTVLCPTFGLAYGKIQNHNWSVAVARGYNDWLYDTYLKLQGGEDVADYIQRQISENRIFIGT